MGDNQKIYDAVNKILKNKIFHYNGKFTYGTIEVDCEFKIQITEEIPLLHMGHPKTYLGVEVQILKLDPDVFITLLNNLETWRQIKDRVFHFSSSLENEIWQMFKYAGIGEPMITKIIPPRQEQQITESTSEKRNVVREVVRDVVKVFRTKGGGEYTLPEDLTGEMSYNFQNLDTEFTLELVLNETEEIPGFDLDGGYYDDEDTMEIKINYNPKYFPQLLYELIGQLNETVRHELEHLLQAERGDELPTGNVSREKYYLQPHEIQAQLAGFRRLSKLKKMPIEDVIRLWFWKNQSVHKLTDKQVEKVTNVLLSHVKK